ncbi:MAG: NADP-dependent malic enzyme [Nitrososphaerota archaeon]|jgi:malate dehydrogenase (oxaloacetate-decarboxylating)|nr:NADP-dependent malic enzyme [Nitrososphaerota archaeon]MDG6932827.1 NADP-dependent malic enzyme [Nitrososphaerota archaeon]MDG6935374.1 NADP-dependent malic enzyme [Nitrososphaerota archaeon]MDG6944902.1 NADP-dependent malic enzyme [Nitrososphaerota archaeon]
MDPIEFSKIYEGKIQVFPKVPIKSYDDFAVIYTPGIAKVAEAVHENRDLSFSLTSRWNTIAIITNGSRVLGLGNIGPEAAMPVMEGKALLFKYLGGVDAIPIPIRADNAEDFKRVAMAIEPALGGINLEDTESPLCFEVLEELRKSLEIPVWHDDQLGTASAILAGLINGFKIAGKSTNSAKVVLFGAGAANIAAANLLEIYGFNKSKIIMIDSKGPLYPDREDIDKLMFTNKWKYNLAVSTNKDDSRTINDAFNGADAVIAASTPGPHTIKKEWIAKMADKPIVFALANPIPEIMPDEAYDNGAYIVATGRSDFPNQVNNSLVFPGVFRGVLDSRAKYISYTMAIAASQALAAYAERHGLDRQYIIPRMDEWSMFYEVAAAVADRARVEGYARNPLKYEEYLELARKRIIKTKKNIEVVTSDDN